MGSERKATGLSRPGSGRHGTLSGRELTDLSAHACSDDTGDADDVWNEHTPVLDMAGVFRKVGQTAGMVKTLVDKMPQLEGKVDVAIGAARNAQREAFDAKTAATLAQQRVEDVCKRVENLEPLKVNGATTQVKLAGLEEELEKDDAKRQWVLGLVIAIILSGLGSLGTAIWWARGVDSEAIHETQRREAADKVLIEHIERRPTRDEVLGRNELKALRDELIKQRQPTVDEWLLSLPPAKQREIKRLLGTNPAKAQ